MEEHQRQVLKAVAELVRFLEHELGVPAGNADIERLRALLTVRPPRPLPPPQQSLLDDILDGIQRDRGIVACDGLPAIALAFPATRYPAAAACALWRGDITRLRTDAIVNAANAQLLGCFVPHHRCIDNAIHWHAGPALRLDCDRIMREQGRDEATGQAQLTRAHRLPSSFVIHTVGPIVRGALEAAHREQLAQSYRACLDLADAHGGIASIAFCCVSTGVFGFPKPAAAQIALDTVARWLGAGPRRVKRVVFNVYDETDERAYATALEAWR